MDYGKNAFTFIRRSNGKAIRIVTRADAWGVPDPEHQALRAKVSGGKATEEEQERFQKEHLARADMILERPLEEIFTVTPVQPQMPAKARINNSITCEGCGEALMETRSRLFQSKSYCIPCFEQRDRRYTL